MSNGTDKREHSVRLTKKTSIAFIKWTEASREHESEKDTERKREGIQCFVNFCSWDCCLHLQCKSRSKISHSPAPFSIYEKTCVKKPICCPKQ